MATYAIKVTVSVLYWYGKLLVRNFWNKFLFGELFEGRGRFPAAVSLARPTHPNTISPVAGFTLLTLEGRGGNLGLISYEFANTEASTREH